MKGTGNSQIIIYTGEEEGKNTASMGQKVRALGHDGRCAVAQFVKEDPSKPDCGEWKTLTTLGVL